MLKKNVFFVFFLLAEVALAASPRNGDRESNRASLLVFADAFDLAQIAGDRTALEDMVSDELIFIDGSGARGDKRAFISGWTVPGVRYLPITLVDRTITLLGQDVGIVGAEVELEGESDGKHFRTRLRFSDTFKRIKGRWRAVHIHVTRVPPARN